MYTRAQVLNRESETLCPFLPCHSGTCNGGPCGLPTTQFGELSGVGASWGSKKNVRLHRVQVRDALALKTELLHQSFIRARRAVSLHQLAVVLKLGVETPRDFPAQNVPLQTVLPSWVLVLMIRQNSLEQAPPRRRRVAVISGCISLSSVAA